MPRTHHRPAVHELNHRVARTAALVVLATTIAAVAVIAPSAHSGLVPPAPPWPTAVTGAVNPLVGTPSVLNGGQATVNARLRVWLPVGRQRRLSITRVSGGRTVIRGELRNRDTRRAIGGAIVTLAAQSVYGGDWLAIGNAPTNRKGTFRTVLPPGGGTRRVAVLYWPAVTSPTPLYSRRLLVRASGRVYLARPQSTAKRSLRFDGRVSGAPVPPTGLLVALQVRNRLGNWVTARLARTNADGRYRVRYRFAPGKLTIRVSAPAQTGWPLFGGQSQSRRVRVR